VSVIKSKTVVLALAALVCASPAFAQKSKDTLRIALNTSVPILSPYDQTLDDAGFFSHEIYETLIKYDEYNKKLIPWLAKSWKRIDTTTIEFELRDDIQFNNGDSFEADDVKATHAYITDPKAKIIYPPRYSWMKEIEVLGPHKIRIHAAQPTGTDLNTIAYRLLIWDGKVLGKLADRSDYGRQLAVGSGPYKATQIDANKGVIVERFDGHKTSGGNKKVDIKKIAGIPIPDLQTQSAELMIGNIDILRVVPPDIAKALAENPNIKMTYLDVNDQLLYLGLDSTGVAGNKALTDPRVRKAIAMAVDRDSLIKHIVPGGEIAEHIDADCFSTTIACGHSVPAEKYDPAAAKKLLAEAGYPDGFDMNYVVYTPSRPMGETIAGDLLKIGIRAKIQVAELGLFRRLQADGKSQAWTAPFATGGNPDAGNIMSSLFNDITMKYFDDEVLVDAMKRGEAEFDPDARTAIYAKAFDRINEMHYHVPISSVPAVFVHTKDMKVVKDPLSASKIYATDFKWN
jgi:peptide/nickel transport system substrate-binding protein